VQHQKKVIKPAAAVQPRRDENLELVRDRDRPAIESLMMDAAAGKPVVGSVRSPKLAPANVCGLKPQIRVVEPDCIPAERASMSPGRQNRIPKFRIASDTASGGVQFKTDCIDDTRVQRIWKVSREKDASQFPDGFGATS
jgi:hypothetical protein